MKVSFEKAYTDTGRPMRDAGGGPGFVPHHGDTKRWIKAIKISELDGMIEPLEEWLEDAGFAVAKQSKTGVLFVYPREDL